MRRQRRMQHRTEHRAALLSCVLALLLQACAGAPPPRGADGPEPVVSATMSKAAIVARNDDFAIVIAQPGDDVAALAARHLGDAGKGWWIAEFSGTDRIASGDVVTIPLKGPSPLGVTAQGFQTIPILCYHRFGSPKRRLVVARADFEAQMDYLARNGYHVIPLSRLTGFLEGRDALPPKSVVITIDDGYRSTYEIAYPILRKYGFPATVFLYSDFVGAGDAMPWSQMQEMLRSGLIEIQPHSKTHSNLTLRQPNETPDRYRDRVRSEVERPTALIAERLGVTPLSYAFPYGDVNEAVVAELQRAGLLIGTTVTPGGNAFFAYPYMLRRSMVFGTDDMDTFKSRLQVFTARTPRAGTR
jgi:peptidoglycan/xylan/chitin deacetylase (PgdA/CDA1 family)